MASTPGTGSLPVPPPPELPVLDDEAVLDAPPLDEPEPEAAVEEGSPDAPQPLRRAIVARTAAIREEPETRMTHVNTVAALP